MALPAYTDTGDLPTGVHRVSLSEVLHHFGLGSVQRSLVAQRLERVYRLAAATGHLRRFVVFGSFVTYKPEPNDADIFLLMEDTFDVALLTGESRLVFEHSAAQSYFGASVFWLRRMAILGNE